MKLIRLIDGTDILDLRGQFGAETDTLPDGRVVPRFLLYALDGRSTTIDPTLRGRAIEVEDSVAEEFLTFPNLVFEETDAATASADTYRRTLVRDTFGRLLDPKTGQVVATGADGAAAVPEPPVVAESVPQTPDQITAQVQAELAAGVPHDATPTDQQAAPPV